MQSSAAWARHAVNERRAAVGCTLTVRVDGGAQGTDNAGSRAPRAAAAAKHGVGLAGGRCSRHAGAEGEKLCARTAALCSAAASLGTLQQIVWLHIRLIPQSHTALDIQLQSCMTSLFYRQVVAGII